ncbi:MAG: phage portal protein [Caulobacterales bacterium]|nr:phage portal protein [Caulobacterales bacterium]
MFDWRRPFGRRREAASETKASAVGRVIAFSHVGRPVWTPRDYSSLAREGFACNPVVYRCIRLIAEAAASVPLAVFDGEARRDDHPLVARLERPNPEQSRQELFEQMFGYLQTAGNAYLEAVDDGGGEFYALRPDRVRVVPGANGWPAAYDYTAGALTRRLVRAADGFSPVLHLKLFNPIDDWYGASPLEAAAWAVDVHNASAAWNKALLDNQARPSGALVFGGGHLSPEQFQSLKDELEANYTGAANAGRPMLLEGGLEWTPMALSPQDLDHIEGKHAAAREIALAFGVPPQLLGIPGDNTYQNFREAQGAFWRQTIVPLVGKTAGALTAWLAPRWPVVTIRPDLDGVPGLASEREALWARLEAASFLTPEERRRMAGLSGE